MPHLRRWRFLHLRPPSKDGPGSILPPSLISDLPDYDWSGREPLGADPARAGWLRCRKSLTRFRIDSAGGSTGCSDRGCDFSHGAKVEVLPTVASGLSAVRRDFKFRTHGAADVDGVCAASCEGACACV